MFLGNTASAFNAPVSLTGTQGRSYRTENIKQSGNKPGLSLRHRTNRLPLSTHQMPHVYHGTWSYLVRFYNPKDLVPMLTSLAAANNTALELLPMGGYTLIIGACLLLLAKDRLNASRFRLQG